MAENKIFAGPHIRRIRTGLGLTQTAMAEALGISPSYLNLVERNQRPLTVQLILKLSETYDADLSALQGGERQGQVAALRAVFADPLLAGELPGEQELVEIAATAPNVASGIAKLYRAYREQHGRLSDLSGMLAGEGRGTRLAGARMPIDEVRDVFENRPNHFAAIETAAEAFHQTLSPGEDLMGALRTWLRREHEVSVRVLPVDTMPNWRRRFDRHSRRLFLSERLGPADRLREVAMEVALFAFAPVIEAEAATFTFASAEAVRLARYELVRYAALALMMPYAPFQAAALRAAYDIDVLSGRFQVSFEQAANRLTTLQRQSAPGVPFFMLEVDHAGNRFRRAGARGFPQQRFGGGCPKLSLHDAFSQPGRVLVDVVEMPGGEQYLTVARTLEGLNAGYAERPRRTALLLGCDIAFAGETVYGRGLGERPVAIGIGPACRLCERQACLARAEPPLTRPLGLDEMVTGLGAFDFQ
jgi:predicted transcriptional regulator/transcriptional regulator with XRE-family HTH domain